MKKILLVGVALLLSAMALRAQKAMPNGLTDNTLRLNYIFTGSATRAHIALCDMNKSLGWAGRRINLDTLILRGNGEIIMKDSLSAKVIYKTSFSTLFQEWQQTEEAVSLEKSFENVFLVPMPCRTAYITVNLYDIHNKVAATLTHKVNPKDILIKRIGSRNKWFIDYSEGTDKDYGDEPGRLPYRYTHKSGLPEEKIDVAIVAEGYTKAEMDIFYADAKKATEDILSHEPFKSQADKFNFIAVGAVSRESGVSIPHNDLWLNTALGSHFDTFYMERYLTTLHLFKLHDALSGMPYEHIIILANTDNYGGGGIYNSYVLSAAHNGWATPVIVHEFGHSFGGLADEYFYDDGYSPQYIPEVEPWEPNITTLADFSLKWQDMMGAKDKPYTKAFQHSKAWTKLYANEKAYKVGLYEGGGYLSEGVYRPYPTCRMRENRYSDFCPVCRRAIMRLIEFYVGIKTK